jgi:flagellum-specific ATP synthase
MVDVIEQPHAKAATHFRRLWSTYEENRDLLLMGAYVPGNDAVLDEAISRRGDMVAFLRQNSDECIDLAATSRLLSEGFGA